MFYKEDIIEILENKKENEVLTIYYDGFTGIGINGVQDKSISIRSLEDSNNIVSFAEHSDGVKIKTEIINLEIKDNYIKASFEKYRKGKYCDNFFRIKVYSVLVPYNSIQSIELYEIS